MNMTTENTPETSQEASAATSSRTFKLVTLRIPPEMHQDVTVLAGKLQAERSKQVSVNSLINEAIEQYLKRHKNPKMIRDFEGL